MTETVTHTGFWLTLKQYTVKPMKHYGLVSMNVGGCKFIGFWFLCATKSKYTHLIHLCAIYYTYYTIRGVILSNLLRCEKKKVENVRYI